MAPNRSSNLPEGLPRVLRLAALTWVAAWLIWQLFGPVLDSLEISSKWIWLGRLLLLLGSALVALRLCNSNRTAGWQWRDLLIAPLAISLLAFQLSMMPLRLEPDLQQTSFAPWTNESLSPDQTRKARVLEALWQDALWFETSWSPVVHTAAGPPQSADAPEDAAINAATRANDVEIILKGQGQHASMTLSHDGTSSDLPLLGPGGNPLTILSGTLSALREVHNRSGSPSPEIHLGPGNDMNWFQCRIDAHSSSGNDQALVALRSAVFETPDRATAHTALADCLHERARDPGWVHETRASANRAFRLDPDSAWSRRLLAQLAWNHELKAGAADLHWQNLLARYPRHAGLGLDRARMLFAAGLAEQAAAQRELAMLSAPEHPAGQYLLALESLGADDTGGAFLQLEHLYRRHPNQIEIRQAILLAAARMDRSQLVKVLDDLSGARPPIGTGADRTLSEDASESMALQIWALAKANRTAEAESLRARYFAEAPTGNSRSYPIAIIQDGLGNREAAERALVAAALARDPRLARPVSSLFFSGSATMRELRDIWQSELISRLPEKEISNSP